MSVRIGLFAWFVNQDVLTQLKVRVSTALPVLIPSLIATPMTVFNARDLASLVIVAGLP
jgi:hypothetical protein